MEKTLDGDYAKDGIKVTDEHVQISSISCY